MLGRFLVRLGYRLGWDRLCSVKYFEGERHDIYDGPILVELNSFKTQSDNQIQAY